MEAENSRLAHQGLHHHHHHHQHEHHHHIQKHHHEQQLTLPNSGIPGLDVVRALHQTVISLRSALESSREELQRLRRIVKEHNEGETYSDTVERLSLENHVLRRRILRRGDNKTDVASITASGPKLSSIGSRVMSVAEAPGAGSAVVDEKTSDQEEEKIMESVNENIDNTDFKTQDVSISKEKKEEEEKEEEEESDIQQVSPSSAKKISPDDDNKINEPELINEEENCKKLSQDFTTPEKENIEIILENISGEGDTSPLSDNQPSPGCSSNHENSIQIDKQQQQSSSAAAGESENESEELDDIELIFTTDDNCREIDMQEVLVSITEPDNWQKPGKTIILQSSQDETVALDDVDMNAEDEEDDQANVTGKTNSVDEACSSQCSSVDRGENVDRFIETAVSNPRLQKIWSQCSVLVETDISKCGVVEQIDHHHHPVVHNAERRNTLAGPSTSYYRPIIHRESQGIYGRRKSLVPLRPMMDNGTNGARRENGVQTDISALPSHWRSESYLAHKVAHTFTTLPSKFALPTNAASRLKLSDKTREARRVMLSDISFTSMVPELSRSADHLTLDLKCQQTPEWHRPDCSISSGSQWPKSNMRLGLHSPCECRVSTELFSSRFRSSLASIPSPVYEVAGSPPPRRQIWRSTNPSSFETCKIGNMPSTSRLTWSSVPSSPTHICPFSSTRKCAKNNVLTKSRQRVTFQEGPMIRGSMPNLSSDVIGSETSGDSTESLIDEAEAYLRGGIDSMLKISSPDRDSQPSSRRRRSRRNSETDATRKGSLPKNARPFLPKHPRDLKLDNFVKVISPEGKVLQGKVRWIGPLPGTEEIHVGVELPTDAGSTDGTFHGRRFFNCEQDCGVFVPYKKVILAWCTI